MPHITLMLISRFNLFFANDLLQFYIYFRLQKWCQIKSKSEWFFLFKFKMGRVIKHQTAYKINNAFGPGTAKKCREQQWFKKFCKGDESFEDEEHSGRPLEGANSQLRAIIKADLLKTTWEVAKEFNIYYSKIVWHLKQIGKVKKLYKRVPHELTLNQNKSCF